jgi:N utilization substance protein B
MISRRNIWVKVMQTLYTLDAQEQAVKPGEASRILQKHFDQSRQLLSYLLYFIIEVARYAETDSRVRASKHPPAKPISMSISNWPGTKRSGRCWKTLR